MENFDFNKKTKLVRHTNEKKQPIEAIYKNGILIDYQSVQINDVFNGCNYLISFIATESTKAKFVGVFEIIEQTRVKQVKKIKPLPDIGIDKFYQDNAFYYAQKETNILSDLKDRLIIEWGDAPLAWYQNLAPKEVVEILPRGYYDKFPGFDEVLLTYDGLKEIIDNPDPNREWHIMLSSVAGIYLIVDTETGKQYVGSASGKDGILGRWKQYALNGHGGNKLIKELLEEDPQRFKKFQYTILRTLPKALTPKEVVKVETLYKKKLGSRNFGLNM
jgi:hypothetical protein